MSALFPLDYYTDPVLSHLPSPLAPIRHTFVANICWPPLVRSLPRWGGLEIIPTNKIQPVSCHWEGSFRFPPRACCLFSGRPAKLTVLEAKRPIPVINPALWHTEAAVSELCASSPSSACIAFFNRWASAKPVLILAKEICSTFAPRGFTVLYPISRSGIKPQSWRVAKPQITRATQWADLVPPEGFRFGIP